MRWRKLGKIFDPTRAILPNGCTEFAQSPQALVFDAFVRIYFSTRMVEESTGKYLSHIAFVDLSKDLAQIMRVSTDPVISAGDLGCFDEHGIFPMSVLRHDGVVYGYTCGWSRRSSVSVETAIGLAISRDDGLSFERVGPGPVLGASLHEPFLVGDGFVRVVGGTFHMWYIFGTSWTSSVQGGLAERTYKIGHATSADGVSWTRAEGRQIIDDRLGPEECQALPSVIQIGATHHMFFCYRETFDFRANPARAYRIGHAVSEDLVKWTRSDADPIAPGETGSWDSDMQCYPNVFASDGHTYLLYNGNDFGRYGFGLAVLDE